jgi:formylmethanofuran dehydrogenase subunit E
MLDTLNTLTWVESPLRVARPTLADLLAESAARHKHLCPRQVLGVRIGLLGVRWLGIEAPNADKRLLAFVETDGCAADGVSVASDCSVGHRTLRVVDYGKVAATFVDTRTGRAVRVAPRRESRALARLHAPGAKSRWHAQLEAYQVMPDDELLVAQPVVLSVSLEQLLSKPGRKTMCAACGEEIINEREVTRDGMTVCRACAGEAYYRPG